MGSMGMSVSFCGDAERLVVCRHGEFAAGHGLPEQRGGQVDRVDRAKLGRHWLRSAIQNGGVEFDHVQRRDERQDGGTASRHLFVGQLRS